MFKNCYAMCLGASSLLLSIANFSVADVTIFASAGNDLFRITGNTVDQFDLGRGFAGMGFDENGVLWATGLDSTGTVGRIFNITDPFGTPSFVEFSSADTRGVNAIQWVGNTLYAMEREIGTNDDRTLVTLDTNSGVGTPVGATGDTGARIGGMAVDKSTGTMFAMDAFGFLLSVDWQLQNGSNPEATPIGSLIGPAEGGGGLDFFEGNDTLYAILALGDPLGQRPVGIFTVNTGTGEATEILDLDPFSPGQGGFAIAVVPEPGTLVMFAVMGAVALKRKRRNG